MPATTRNKRRVQSGIALERLLDVPDIRRIVLPKLDPATVLSLWSCSKAMRRHVESVFSPRQLEVRRMVTAISPETETLLWCMHSKRWNALCRHQGHQLRYQRIEFRITTEGNPWVVWASVQRLSSRGSESNVRVRARLTHSDTTRPDDTLAEILEVLCPLLNPAYHEGARLRHGKDAHKIEYFNPMNADRMVATMLLNYPDAYVRMGRGFNSELFIETDKANPDRKYWVAAHDMFDPTDKSYDHGAQKLHYRPRAIIRLMRRVCGLPWE
jgi:hypothetical protein